MSDFADEEVQLAVPWEGDPPSFLDFLENDPAEVFRTILKYRHRPNGGNMMLAEMELHYAEYVENYKKG